jgi:hypothetical protein
MERVSNLKTIVIFIASRLQDVKGHMEFSTLPILLLQLFS